MRTISRRTSRLEGRHAEHVEMSLTAKSAVMLVEHAYGPGHPRAVGFAARAIRGLLPVASAQSSEREEGRERGEHSARDACRGRGRHAAARAAARVAGGSRSGCVRGRISGVDGRRTACVRPARFALCHCHL